MLNEAGLQSVIDTVGDPRSRRQVPSHPHGRKMKGNIHIPGIRDRGSEQYEGLMARLGWRCRVWLLAVDCVPAVNPILALHPDTLRFIWYLADIIAQRSMPLEDAAFGRHFVPDDGPAAEVLARKRAATYQRLTMQLTLEALLSGARRMTPLRAQALLEPEDSSSSDFVESPEEESSPEVSDSDGGNTSSGADDRRGAGEASPSLTVTSGASGELDTTGVLAAASRCGLCTCRFSYAMTTPPRAFIPLAISTDGTLHPDTLRFIWYLADIIAQRSMPLEDAAFGRHFVPDDGPAAEVLARKRAATYQRLTMQLTLEALLSGARRMTPLRAQALLEPEDSSSSDFVESPEESSPEVSDSDGGNTSSGPDDRRGAGEASPSLTVTSGASGELDTTGAACLRGFALGLALPRLGASSAALHPDTLRFIWYLADIIAQRSMPLEDAAFGRHFVPDDGPAAEVLARKRAATYQRLTMQLTLEALLSGARRMTPLRAQALLEPEDSSSSDFVESPEEESSPEVSDSDGGNTSSGADDRRGAGEASPSLTVTSGASGELDTTGVLAAAAAASPPSRAVLGYR
ncbi:hypothetical protein GUITHDRAFT_108166 [Guillardia theta CCMP2712]|uniref:Uncharacterized protein n=1 Tax=Guillardia theta (strain CCMP2712) TaxID=905079 RepID=L1JCT6_GUITC|nr:hypothetical protein GUITHDRAFT_108166 [Guillardia theta CCMP2712]EKX46132.1 hypothetical protein GUITHDRAFT_108166 [Guillardia theta CCMP2712]|eukprot:XP_005833112.1 hypothetical protein GUITHDRAFT_108166 [Guillardia theta CCMP2712]